MRIVVIIAAFIMMIILHNKLKHLNKLVSGGCGDDESNMMMMHMYVVAT